MRRKIIVVSIAIIAMTVFIIIQASTGSQTTRDGLNRMENPYYIERIAAEGEMQDQAIADATAILESLKKKKVDLRGIQETIKVNLKYCFLNFDEMKKGDRADIEITKNLSYSLSLIYNLVMNCDYDGGERHTEKEKALWETSVYGYVNVAFRYFSDCSSLTQEEADYLEASHKENVLSKNLEKEADYFVETLRDVVVEAKEQGLLDK